MNDICLSSKGKQAAMAAEEETRHILAWGASLGGPVSRDIAIPSLCFLAFVATVRSFQRGGSCEGGDLNNWGCACTSCNN